MATRLSTRDELYLDTVDVQRPEGGSPRRVARVESDNHAENTHSAAKRGLIGAHVVDDEPRVRAAAVGKLEKDIRTGRDLKSQHHAEQRDQGKQIPSCHGSCSPDSRV